jgi:hypothetical protein
VFPARSKLKVFSREGGVLRQPPQPCVASAWLCPVCARTNAALRLRHLTTLTARASRLRVYAAFAGLLSPTTNRRLSPLPPKPHPLPVCSCSNTCLYAVANSPPRPRSFPAEACLGTQHVPGTVEHFRRCGYESDRRESDERELGIHTCMHILTNDLACPRGCSQLASIHFMRWRPQTPLTALAT